MCRKAAGELNCRACTRKQKGTTRSRHRQDHKQKHQARRTRVLSAEVGKGTQHGQHCRGCCVCMQVVLFLTRGRCAGQQPLQRTCRSCNDAGLGAVTTSSRCTQLSRTSCHQFIKQTLAGCCYYVAQVHPVEQNIVLSLSPADVGWLLSLHQAGAPS